MKIGTIKYKILIGIFAGFCLAFSFAHASTSLFFKIDNENLKKGDTFNIDLKVSTNKSINVVDGTLIFDKTKLAVKQIRTDNVIFSMWAKNPVFDNNKGTITFIGGIPGGFKGENGQVLGITFKAINDGQTKIDFQDIFSVYLNDGLGTKINPWLEPAQLSIAPSQAEAVVRQTLNILAEKNKENNYLLIIGLIFLLIIIIAFSLKLRKNKKSV